MGTVIGPNIIESNLMLSVDASNSRSYSTSSTTWFDMSGNGFNGGTDNSPGFIYSPIPYIDFTGNTAGSGVFGSKRIYFSSNTVPSTNSFTVEAWINRNVSLISLGDRESLFSNAVAADGFRVGLYSTTQLYYLISGMTGIGYSETPISVSTNFLDGNWHQVGIIFDRAAQLGSYSAYSFLDGYVKSSLSISTGNESFTPRQPGISMGCCSSFKGKVSSLKVYNRSLTSSEIFENFNSLKSRFGIL